MQAVAEPKASKRQRSENWLEEDKITLKELVKERVSVIENKNTDSNTNAKKVAGWNDLRTSFNDIAITQRTLGQLKAQWGLIKMLTKKQKFYERKERLRTGGGPPPASELVSGEDIEVWLPSEFHIETNEFDSDNQVNIPRETKAESKQIENTEKENGKDEIMEVIEIVTLDPEENENELRTPAPNKKPAPSPKLKFKNKKFHKPTSAADRIAAMEVACREELHQAQMANEQQKLKNLKLEQELLETKIKYFKNKNV